MTDLTKLAGVICALCNHILTLDTGHERLGLSDIVFLSSVQLKPQGIAEVFDNHVNLCGGPASAAAKGLRFLPPLLGAPADE